LRVVGLEESAEERKNTIAVLTAQVDTLQALAVRRT
jgi:hypothetical protein